MKTNENNPGNKNNPNDKKDANNQKGNEQAKSNASANTNNQKKSKLSKNKKKIKWMVVTAIPVLLIGGAVIYFTQSDNPKLEQLLNFEQILNEKNDLRTQLDERDALINEYISTFNEVENDLREIRGKEQGIVFSYDSIEYSRNYKKELLGEIEKINEMLDKNRNKIKDLNRKLQQSGVKITALQDKISNLQATISARDSSINALKQIVVEKNNKIANLNDQVGEMRYNLNEKNHIINENSRIIEKQSEMLEKAYLTYGTYKELNEKGVLTKDGGFLWFGRNKKLQEEISDEKFQEINIMEKRTVPLNTKKAELITNHPEGSYEFVKDSAERIAYLKIEDPVEFWKITNYAVLETK